MATRKVRERMRTQVKETPQAATTREGFIAQLNCNVFQQNKVDYYMGYPLPQSDWRLSP